MLPLLRSLPCMLVACLLSAWPAGAQMLPAVQPSDYGRWERLEVAASPEVSTLSPDGRWLAHRIVRSNGESELRVAAVAGDKTHTIAFGERPVFSANSAWVACAIAPPESEREKLQKDKKPVRLKLGLLDLARGETIIVEDIETFAFDATGSHLAMARYAPEPAKPDPAPTAADKPKTDPPDPQGKALIVRLLQSGAETAFGNVTDFAWAEQRSLIAFTVGSKDRLGNAIQLYDAASAGLRVLDSARAIYSGLTWRKGADDLVVLRSSSAADREGSAHTVLAWAGLAARSPVRRELDPVQSGAVPADRRIVSFRKPQFSKDGSRIHLGVAAWRKKDVPPSADRPDVANVDVWHWRDVRVMPQQNHELKADAESSVPAVWHLPSGRIRELTADSTDVIQLPSERGDIALLVKRARYGMERSFGRRRADLEVLSLSTGERQPVVEAVEDEYASLSPDGRYVLYLQDDHYWSFEVATGERRNLTASLPTSFVDLQSDSTLAQKPPHETPSWIRDGNSVLLYDRYDIWEIALTGSRARRLTAGAAEQIVHRHLRLDDDETIERGKPLYLSLFGEWTKRSGFARLALGTSQVQQLLYRDQRIGALVKARSAPVYAYVVQSFQESPDYYVGSASLVDARRVTHTNPFQKDYAWGRAELIEYRNPQGLRLQGVLQYPAGYDPAKRYPLVVYVYERLSDQLHRYWTPSERDPYNSAVFTSQGYFVLLPDIAFRPREPGVSVVECVVPAVQVALARASIDSKRVGVVGHSWGGFDTAYLATHTETFAAAVAGAPITNLISNYGNHHWEVGIAETDHIETGQQRMQVPLWEDLPAYIRNSPVLNVHRMQTPLLLAFGDSDGVVHWFQGVEMYNIARRAGKPVVMLAYPGEDHGIAKRVNRIDYQRRLLQWFGHYLKDEPAVGWIANGVSALEKHLQTPEAARSPPK